MLADALDPCLDHQRVDAAADLGVTAGAAPQLDLARDGVAGGRAVGTDVGRAWSPSITVTLPPGADKRGQPAQGLHRLGEVLEQEADEDVVEDAARGAAMPARAGVLGIADPGCPHPCPELGASDPTQPRLAEKKRAQPGAKAL